MDAVVKRKIPSPRRESNSRTPIVQPVAQRYAEKNKFGLKREEMSGAWRRLHSEEFHDLHTSPNIIKATKSRIMR
jgi:hypothetical protein